jgi:outer membrane protein assembly factor BamB
MNSFKHYIGIGLISILGHAQQAKAQEFQQLIGDFQTPLSSVVIESSPNQFMLAYTAILKDQKKERFLVRLDGKGKESLLVPLNENFELNELCRTKDNHIILASGKQNGKMIEIYRIDENATEIWSKKFEANIPGNLWRFQKMVATADGGFALLATAILSNQTNTFCLFRFDENGKLLGLNNYYQLSQNEEAKGLMASDDGGFWITFAQGNMTHLLKTDAQGGEVFHKIYNDLVNQILFVKGEYLLGGSQTIYKIDPTNGDVKWQKNYCQGSSECYQISSLAARKDGGFVITENKVNADGNIDIFMTEIDEKGVKAKTYSIGSAMNEKSVSELRPTSDGGYLVLGESSDIAYKLSHILVAKTALSNVLGTKDEEKINISLSKMTIQPNPMSSSSLIVLDGEPIQNGTIRVMNMQGQVVAQQVFEGNSVRLERNDLATGLYIISIQDRSGILSLGKIVVE